METFLIKALQLFMSLTILVIVHELGHYTFSRIFGVWVEKFYMFFNPWLSLVKWKPGKHLRFLSHGDEMSSDTASDSDENKRSWRATEYGIGWLPLGGYCKISGMIDESLDSGQMEQPAQPWEFRSKSAWKRLVIMVGGVLFNFLLAIVIYSGIVYMMGENFVNFTDAPHGMEFCENARKIGFQDGDIPLMADNRHLTHLDGDNVQAMFTAKTVTVLRNHRDTVKIAIPDDFIFTANEDAKESGFLMDYRVPVVIDSVLPGGGAQNARFLHGDRLLAINNDSADSYMKLMSNLGRHKGENVEIKFMRNDSLMSTHAVVDTSGKLGIQLVSPMSFLKVTTRHYNLLQSLPRGIELGWTQMANYVSQLKLIFTPQGAESVGGFGTIGSIFPDKWNWYGFWNITAFLSIILAVMNFLPIPALDGGHVLFLLYEIVTRRKPSQGFLIKAQIIGMSLLLALVLFANANDIIRLVFN